MESRNVHSIDDYYIGEVYVSHPFYNLLSGPNKEQSKEMYKQFELIHNGAMSLISGSEYADDEKRKYYNVLLTIFYKCNDKFISLHDGKAYDPEGLDFCKNLKPLIECLPKLDYISPKTLNFIDAITIFGALFKNGTLGYSVYFYPSTLHPKVYPMRKYYVGNLNLYNGYRIDNKPFGKDEHINTPELYLLLNSGARMVEGHEINGEPKDKYDLVYDDHKYEKFKCLFLNHEDRILNLHNNQYYSNGVLKKEHLNNVEIGTSYYDWMIPYDEYIKQQGIDYEYETACIPRALSLFRKIK